MAESKTAESKYTAIRLESKKKKEDELQATLQAEKENLAQMRAERVDRAERRAKESTVSSACDGGLVSEVDGFYSSEESMDQVGTLEVEQDDEEENCIEESVSSEQTQHVVASVCQHGSELIPGKLAERLEESVSAELAAFSATSRGVAVAVDIDQVEVPYTWVRYLRLESRAWIPQMRAMLKQSWGVRWTKSEP